MWMSTIVISDTLTVYICVQTTQEDMEKLKNELKQKDSKMEQLSQEYNDVCHMTSKLNCFKLIVM